MSRFFEDGPDRDPLEVAAEHAAERLIRHEPLDSYDLDALKQWASNELREHDAHRVCF